MRGIHARSCGTEYLLVACAIMSDKPRPPWSEIVVEVEAEPSVDRRRLAARIVAILKQAGIPANVILPENGCDSSDDGRS